MKGDKTKVKDKIYVGFKKEEFETIKEKIKTEVTKESIRNFFGLKPTIRQAGYTSQIKILISEQLKTMSDEQKAAMLKKLSKKE